MPDHAPSLDDILEQAVEALESAAADPGHPFRWVCLATVDPNGYPRLRTMVLRGFDWSERRLTFYTDARSAKVAELDERPRGEALVYDPSTKRQVRLSGLVVLETGPEADGGIWKQLPPKARINYATVHPPGDPIPDPAEGKPVQNPETLSGKTFCAVHLVIEAIDIVELGRESHLRARFAIFDAKVDGTWVTP
ncbi:MAG: pyridoxamine 5'-phosphate oxidase family protein [Opitutales bacterium]